MTHQRPDRKTRCDAAHAPAPRQDTAHASSQCGVQLDLPPPTDTNGTSLPTRAQSPVEGNPLTATAIDPAHAAPMPPHRAATEGDGKVRGRRLVHDPIQLYLTDVGSAPLLGIRQERVLTRELEKSRAAYLRTLARSDYVLRGVARILTLIQSGRLRLDRTINLWVIDVPKKQAIQKLIEPCTQSILEMLQRNGDEFRIAMDQQRSHAERQDAWRGIIQRRDDAHVLVKQLDLRPQCFDPLLINLVDICREMLTLKDEVDLFEGNGHPQRDRERRQRLHRLMWLTRESPRTLSRHVRRTLNARRRYLQARHRLALGNLRLVVSIARPYRRWAMSFQDLIQEGNIGLMRAVDKFDRHRGHKFSTYALWWIRQGITRALAEQGRTIRLPFHLHGPFKRVQNAMVEYLVEHGREPSLEQLAQLTGLSLTDTQCLMRLSQAPLSLEYPCQQTSNGDLRDMLPDSHQEDPLAHFTRHALKDELHSVLELLELREREVLRLRYGLLDGHSRSLVEVGEIMSLSRESIRLIEKKAFATLRNNPAVAPLAELIDP